MTIWTLRYVATIAATLAWRGLSFEPAPIERSSAAPAVGASRIQSATFNGMKPGVSTLGEVGEEWGRPTKAIRHGADIRHVYTIEPFERVDAVFCRQRLVSLVVHLRQAFDAPVLAEQLELGEFTPVAIVDDAGTSIGLVYPERAVTFRFVAGNDAQVVRIEMNEIAAAPFLLRAEAQRTCNCAGCLADIEQAISISPDSPEPLVLRAQLQFALADYSAALASSTAALKRNPKDPASLTIHAQVLAALGNEQQALAAVNEAIANGMSTPYRKAAALVVRGQLLFNRVKPDGKGALDQYVQAIQLAEAVLDDHTGHCRDAREVLIDAHALAAVAIAHGDWNDRAIAVPKWLAKAIELSDRSFPEDRDPARLRVCRWALSACTVDDLHLDPTPWVAAIEQAAARLNAAIDDPQSVAMLERELGLALNDAMRAHEDRGDAAGAKYCVTRAAACFEHMAVLDPTMALRMRPSEGTTRQSEETVAGRPLPMQRR
ncbi:MAG TPA: hypothetical protein VG713_04675 [Pirellulales bacterium]|nr:hypothetical protein [Pirellulales bacterium]